MTKILEIRDKIIKFYGEYETYLFPVVRFVLAFAAFITISLNLGYSTKLSKLPVTLILALVCSILPTNAIIVVAGLLILINLYALSLEAAIIGLLLFLIIYFVYFRFAPKDSVFTILTPLCFKINIPYVLPVSVGLVREAYSVIGVVCGTVVFYFLDGVRLNATTLHEVVQNEDATTGMVAKFNLLIGQIVGNREMYMIIVIFILTAVITNLVRRIRADHAWTLAIVSGVLIQTLGLFIGYTWLGVTGKTLILLIGSVVALLVGFILQFVLMQLDYARTERVQFEDDTYYYYVKAVPKKMVASEEKTVKHFGNTASMGKRIEKKAIVEELEIGDDSSK